MQHPPRPLGEAEQARLVRMLRFNPIIGNSRDLAEDIARHAELVITPAQSDLISDGASDDDLHFIVSGRLQVLVRHREVALLGAGEQVGELSLVDPRAFRSATVRALTDTVTAKVSEATFAKLASRHPSLWRRMAQILGNYLREDNRFLRRPNPRPRVFIASSPAGMPLAQALAASLGDSDHELPTWLVDTGCHADASSLAALADSFTDSDFGVIVIAPGDATTTAGSSANRDALFFECGVCLGVLGPQRTILVQPADLEKGSTFAGALGLEPALYRPDDMGALKQDLAAITRSVRETVESLRCR